MKFPAFLFAGVLLVTGCTVNRSSFSPEKKYAPAQLQDDYTVFRKTLETHHPGLYWYTPREQMDHYFEAGQKQLNDSLTEGQFRKLLSWVIAKINCGHTTIRPSKSWNKYYDTARLGQMFPLSLKIWDGGMVVTSNLNRRDSILTRGTLITRINGKTKEMLADSLFEYISTDGYNRTHKFQSLSNRGFFGSLFTSVYGTSDTYRIEYLDSTGQPRTTLIPAYRPAADTFRRAGTRAFRQTVPQPSRRERRLLRLNSIRLLRMDTANQTAMMDLGSFNKGYGLKKFFRNSFRALHRHGIGHLIIDIRGNGGGSVTNSTLISRYIATEKFRIADSLFSIRRSSPYEKYIRNHFWNKLFMTLITRKKKDGYYHFGYFERHYFQPKKNNHFDGKVYILTGGNSFSAATLFASALVKQDNVTVVGEETGGGAYGNSAWLIPDATLPQTGIRFRLPLFRLVIDRNIPKNGRGVQPEVEALPTVEAIRRNADFKTEKAMELIRKDKEKY
ncbi:MAG: S41 family peptidase [Chitinophagaceae bacterium]